MKKLNLFTTQLGTIFVSLDKELTEDSLVKTHFCDISRDIQQEERFKAYAKNVFGVARKLGNFMMTAKSIAECEFLGSYENLEAASQAVKNHKAALEAAFK
jgi:hypothetical protein